MAKKQDQKKVRSHGVSMTPEMAQAAREAAERKGLSFSGWVRFIIRQNLGGGAK